MSYDQAAADWQASVENFRALYVKEGQRSDRYREALEEIASDDFDHVCPFPRIARAALTREDA